MNEQCRAPEMNRIILCYYYWYYNSRSTCTCTRTYLRGMKQKNPVRCTSLLDAMFIYGHYYYRSKIKNKRFFCELVHEKSVSTLTCNDQSCLDTISK